MGLQTNVTNSIFEGFNDKHGLMICGYEHGHSVADQKRENEGNSRKINELNPCTFSNQVPRYGDDAKSWPYQNTIKKWFRSWGFPLDEDGLGGRLEKSIILTNWANTQGHNMNNEHGIVPKLLSDEQVENFLHHIRTFKPSVILFMGSELIRCLNDKKVLPHFEAIVGKSKGKAIFEPRPVGKGIRFKVYFQTFQHSDGSTCEVVCFPHPSGSRGIRDEYFAEYRSRMSPIISQFE